MNLSSSRILITGAAGGIGQAVAQQLAAQGAHLVLVDRTLDRLLPLREKLLEGPGSTHVIAGDISKLDSLEQLVGQARERLGGIDALVNIAGVMSFRPFATESAQGLADLTTINLVAPMVLSQQVLPDMIERGAGRIVNVGSIFGSIGFAWFSAYSASKFGLRGFSESLRRELADTGVGVTYVAPRATATPLANVFGRMAEAVKMKLDQPEKVAAKIVAALARDANDVYIGFPESLFVRINALLPRFVDRALRGQDKVATSFARDAHESQRPAAATAPAQKSSVGELSTCRS